MPPRCLAPILLLLLALLACGPSQDVIQTAIVQTQARQATATLGAAQTLTAAVPTATGTLLRVHTPTATQEPSPTRPPAPSRTPRPTNTTAPRPTASPRVTAAPTASRTPSGAGLKSPTPTRKPAPAGPTFLDSAVSVKRQIEVFGGQIDIAVGSGTIDCQQTVDSYEYVAARTTLNNVPASLAGAYQLYSQGVTLFVAKAADLYQNCKNFLADPNSAGEVPPLQWTVARTAVNDAGNLLRQAIIAAGGTP